MISNMPRYEQMKDSGVEWLGEIPEHWEVKRLKYLLELISVKEYSKVSLKKYIGMENIESWSGRHQETNTEIDGLSSAFEPRDILFGKLRPYLAKVYLATEQGICSTEFLVYRAKKTSLADYFKYLLLTKPFINLIDSSTYGSKMPRASSDFIANQMLIFPPLSEQTAIAQFLDQKAAQIDQAISLKQQQIELLKERKQLLIQHAVTKGLNPAAPMRDSGVEWIGEIPEHWEVKRLKYVLDERKERSKKGEEPLFMVSQIHGLVVRSEYHAKAEVAQSTIDNKIVHKNDLVFNKLKAHLGVFFKSNIEFNGIVSPDYAVYKPKAFIDDLKYLEYLFRHPAYIEQFIIKATGIVEGLIRLYTTALFEIPIPIPSSSEQKNILSFIETQSAKIDKAINLQQQQIDKLKEYKATLINSAVTGKIKVV